MATTALPFTRDMRSAAHSIKRDRDAAEKWCLGNRPSSGVKWNPITEELSGGSDLQRQRVRPEKATSQSLGQKNNANVMPKPTMGRGYFSHDNSGTALRSVYARMEAADQSALPSYVHTAKNRNPCTRAPLKHYDSPLSRSLLELLPTHSNNTFSSVSILTDIDTAPSSSFATASLSPTDDDPPHHHHHPLASPDAGVFYSFERKEAPGGPIDLGDLVERAERRWEGQRTERLVRGEWEVLDEKGERMRLRSSHASGGRRDGHAKKQTTSSSLSSSSHDVGGKVKDVPKDSLTSIEDDFELI